MTAWPAAGCVSSTPAPAVRKRRRLRPTRRDGSRARTRADFIVGLEATATVLAAKAEECAANGTSSSARAQTIGGYFNDGSSGGAGDRTGDIVVIFELRKDGDGGNRIVASVNRCTEATCPFSTAIVAPGNPSVFTTSWAVGTPVTLRTVWETENDRFRFVLDPGSAGAEARFISYAGIVTDASPPVADFKSIRILNITENCVADRARTRMEVLFDEVAV